MRISVPNIPKSVLLAKSTAVKLLPAEAIDRVATFLAPGNTAVLTGAGVSVDSGIRAYRGKDGRYMNPNYKPIFYHELVDETAAGVRFRRRYWLRSFLGYPPVRDAQPNTSHYALAALQCSSHVSRIITQNVDGLHHKAISTAWGPARIQHNVLELHGTLHRVRCSHGHLVDRNVFQQMLATANPQWQAYAEEVERTGNQPRTNPDGDVAVEHLGISYESFVVPDCPRCLFEDRINSVFKPEVIFFGESIPEEWKEKSYHDIEVCDRLLLIGTTLATYSAFRVLRHAQQLHKPILVINVGPTRADGVEGVEHIDVPSGAILRQVATQLAGSLAVSDPVISNMLQSGIVCPPADDDDRAPRAAG